MMNFADRPVIRFFLLGLLAVALQTTILTDVKIAGVVVQLLLCLSVAAGVLGGSESGATIGFVLGLTFDMVLTSPMGLSALIYGFAGFLGGYVHSASIENPRWLNAVAIGVTSGIVTIVYPVVANWVGVDGWVSPRLLKVVLVVSVANSLMSPFVVPLVRWALVLRRRERMAPMTEVFR